MTDRIFLYDTTLRDGAQTQGVDFSVDDKLTIAHALDALKVDYIEVVGLEQTLWMMTFLQNHLV